MRIGIHTLFLKSGLVGGSEVYTRDLIAALGRIDQDNDYVIFVDMQNQGTFRPLPANFREVVADKRPASVILQAGVDLLHYPGTTIQTRLPGLPAIITVHDLQHLYWPRFFTWRERLRRWRQDRPSIYNAAFIIAISDFTRRTLVAKFPATATRTLTVHSGVAAAFGQPVSAEAKRQLRAKYNLPSRFALYPARPWPHKNHKRLLAAMQIVQNHFHSDCRLVLCGFSTEEVPDSWHRLRQSLTKDTIQILGYLPRRELPALYQTADLLIYPSLFEGFGLPVLEAMASGCPVICSHVASLPEIAGDAAMFIDPFDSADMATAIDRLLSDTALRRTHVAKGRERAGRFSWETTARATLSVYRHACLQ